MFFRNSFIESIRYRSKWILIFHGIAAKQFLDRRAQLYIHHIRLPKTFWNTKFTFLTERTITEDCVRRDNLMQEDLKHELRFAKRRRKREREKKILIVNCKHSNVNFIVLCIAFLVVIVPLLLLVASSRTYSEKINPFWKCFVAGIHPNVKWFSWRLCSDISEKDVPSKYRVIFTKPEQWLTLA